MILLLFENRRYRTEPVVISSDKDWDLLIDENISRFSTVTRKETTIDNWDEHYDFGLSSTLLLGV